MALSHARDETWALHAAQRTAMEKVNDDSSSARRVTTGLPRARPLSLDPPFWSAGCLFRLVGGGVGWWLGAVGRGVRSDRCCGRSWAAATPFASMRC